MENQNVSPMNYSAAKEMINEYKNIHLNDSDFLQSEYFDREDLLSLLTNPKCKGLRIYNAIKSNEDSKQNRFIIMAEDENGKTILNTQSFSPGVSVLNLGMGFIGNEAAILENGSPCPPLCRE
ncbi:MAG: hypothetical protein WAR77_03830 [Saprospiraceae bacterium]